MKKEKNAGEETPEKEKKGGLGDIQKRLESRVTGILGRGGKEPESGGPAPPGEGQAPAAKGANGLPAGEKAEEKSGAAEAGEGGSEKQSGEAETPDEEGTQKEKTAKEDGSKNEKESPEGETPSPDTGNSAERKGDTPSEENKEEEGTGKDSGKAGAKAGSKAKGGKKSAADPAKIEKELDDLLSQREEIEALLSSIEDSYREAMLPDKTYNEVKDKNEKKLTEINKRISVLQKEAPEAVMAKVAQPAPPAGGEETPPATPGPGKVDVMVPDDTAAGEPAPRIGEEKAEIGRAEALIKILEDKIESRLKDVIASASVEVTDKRLGKIDDRIDAVEAAVKQFKTTATSVEGYDKKMTMMNTEVEKTKALVESTKEAKNIMDEKMQRITDSFAEIRSIVYQREASSKEQEVVVDKLKETVSHIDTARLLKEFTVRDEQIRDVNTRLEKNERTIKMLSDTMNKIKSLMTDIGSLENVMKGSKHVGEKLERIQEIENKMKATASRLDGVYVDMKKRLDEFGVYKVNQDKISSMSEDMVKNIEELTRRLSDYATKSELDALKSTMKSVEAAAKEAASASAKAPSTLPPEVRNLQEEKEEIETLLATLEENLNAKAMSKEDYDAARASNEKKLQEIDQKIEEYSKGGPPTASAASSGKGGEESGGSGEGKHGKVMLLAKMRESYENGEISKAAYDKARRLLTKK